MSLRRDVVILACAISAGVHGALAPAHLDVGTGTGVGFVASTVLLAALVLALTLRPAGPLPLAGAALVFTGLLASYALATTTGIPALHPQRDRVDGLALATKAIEAVGLVAALACSGNARRCPTPHPDERNADMNETRAMRPIPLALTMLVAFFAALTALAVSNGHDASAHGNAARTRRRMSRPPRPLSAATCVCSGKTTSRGRDSRSSA